MAFQTLTSLKMTQMKTTKKMAYGTKLMNDDNPLTSAQ
jgi:hypothetical protein